MEFEFVISDGYAYPAQEALNLMDDEIYNEMRATVIPFESNQACVDYYAEKHFEKFGTDFWEELRQATWSVKITDYMYVDILDFGSDRELAIFNGIVNAITNYTDEKEKESYYIMLSRIDGFMQKD